MSENKIEISGDLSTGKYILNNKIATIEVIRYDENETYGYTLKITINNETNETNEKEININETIFSDFNDEFDVKINCTLGLNTDDCEYKDQSEIIEKAKEEIKKDIDKYRKIINNLKNVKYQENNEKIKKEKEKASQERQERIKEIIKEKKKQVKNYN
jgi:hypothetical protein